MLVPTTFQISKYADITPLEGVSISIWDIDYTVCLESGTTDVNGVLTVGLESNTEYRVFLQKSSYTFYPLPKTVAIAEAPETFEFFGTEASTPAIPEGLVWFYGEVKDLTLNPVVNAVVNISLTTTPQAKGEAVLVRSTMQVFTDANGKWGTLISGGTRVSVAIPSCKFSKTGILPYTGTMGVQDLGLYG